MVVVCRQKTADETAPKDHTVQEDEQVIKCAVCLGTVTFPKYQAIVKGNSRHVFANPYGFVYEIVCFSQAPGCLAASPRSMEFSWFPGFSWQIGACSGCGTHIGWIFRSEASHFFGLIIDKLIFP